MDFLHCGTRRFFIDELAIHYLDCVVFKFSNIYCFPSWTPRDWYFGKNGEDLKVKEDLQSLVINSEVSRSGSFLTTSK